jgi:hypothetical protein
MDVARTRRFVFDSEHQALAFPVSPLFYVVTATGSTVATRSIGRLPVDVEALSGEFVGAGS